MERVYAFWNQKKITTAVFLDVTGAFNNVFKNRLLHNLRIKKMDPRIMNWIGSFLTDKSTILKTNEYTSEKIHISTGIPQGSPLSPILFLFYNLPLLEKLNLEPNTHSAGFVDDIAILVEGNTTEDNNTKLLDIHERICRPWAMQHGSKFAPEKYQLGHLTRKRSAHLDHPLSFTEYTVLASSTITYLGAILDSKLNWKEQVTANKSKALKSIGALAGLSGSVWGARLPRMRQMLHAVVIPQLTYACSVWYTPHGEQKHNKSHLKQLVSVQYQAARAITGAYRATSSPALDIETYTLPIEQRLDYLTAKTALRIASTPSYSAITAARPEKRAHYSPLEVLINRLQKNTKSSLSNLEQIIPYTAPPWWTPPPTVIKPSKKEAELAHKNLIEAFPPSENLFVYTDGSGINEKVGASATAKSVTWNSFLGSTDSFTVYSGELYGILLGTGLASHVGYRPGRVFICVDNQASIRAIGNSSSKSGQHIVQRIVEEIEKLRKSGYVIELHWIPAHMGIVGNELADKAAKEATGWRLKKTRRGGTTELDTGSIAAQTTLVKELVLAKAAILGRKNVAEWKNR